MKELLIATGELVKLDDEDYNRIATFNWRLYKGVVRRVVVTGFYNEITPISNEVMQVYKGIFDHKDRDIFNNQKFNLRKASVMQNCWNRGKRKGITYSKYKGVS